MPDLRLDGRNPLGYMGVKPYTPAQMIVRKFAPTQNDFQGYPLGTQWLYWNADVPANSIQYVLTSVSQSVAVWVPLNGGGDDPTLPNHSVALGTGVPGLNSTGPIATLGAPLVSNGISADPSFGVASVSGGGTGLTTVPQYAVITGGVSGEGPLQTVAGLGSAGQVLTSNGLAMLPSWQNSGGGTGGGPIAVQVFTAAGAGTYTPTAGMASCMVECVGGGAGGGSLTAQIGGAGGGGSGAYCRKLFLAAAIGASQPLVVGAGGAAATNGSATTFGTGPLLTAGAGLAGVSGVNGSGGLGGTATGGNLNVPGVSGGTGCNATDPSTADVALSGFGGPSIYGGGGLALSASAGNANGNAGVVYGSGGSGAACSTSATHAGGAGSAGIIIITEYGPYAIAPIAGTQVNIIVFDTPGSGTYTPSSGMTQCIVECVGGGGGAGGVSLTNGRSAVAGALSAGGGGAYCKKIYDSATIGASQPYVVGALGAGGGIQGPVGETDYPGADGGDTTFGTGGTLITAGGGPGGNSGFTAGGVATGGDINIDGGPATAPSTNTGIATIGNPETFENALMISPSGGNSAYGYGGTGLFTFSSGIFTDGNDASGYGAGGGAGYGYVIGLQQPTTKLSVGGDGTSGVIIITEYIGT